MTRKPRRPIGALADLLTVVFIALKLLGVVQWTWLVVLSPFLAALLVALFLYAVAAMLKETL